MKMKRVLVILSKIVNITIGRKQNEALLIYLIRKENNCESH